MARGTAEQSIREIWDRDKALRARGSGESGIRTLFDSTAAGKIRGGGRAMDEPRAGKIRILGFSWLPGTKGKLGWENKSPAGTYGMENVLAGLTL